MVQFQFFTNSASRAAEPPIIQHYTAASRIPERVAWRDAAYTVLDVETTGLNPRRDAILSIGLVEIEQGRILLERAWYALVQPPPHITVPADSIRIHRLFRGDVAAAPTLEQILPELLERLMGRVLVVHFAQIDVDFLNRALHQLWRTKLRGPALDTMRIAQALYHQERWLTGHDGMQSVTNLRELAERANLPIHNEHHALSDAITTAQLFLTQATRLERRGEGLLLHLLNRGRCLR
jgi:DNA polymerase-3 subunit epsilon